MPTPAKRLVDDPNILRATLVRAVDETDLSYKELAERSGVHRRTIASVLAGRQEGNTDTWNRLLNAAGIHIGYRIDWKKVNGNG